MTPALSPSQLPHRRAPAASSAAPIPPSKSTARSSPPAPLCAAQQDRENPHAPAASASERCCPILGALAAPRVGSSIRTTATSIPSAEVPLMTPATVIAFALMLSPQSTAASAARPATRAARSSRSSRRTAECASAAPRTAVRSKAAPCPAETTSRAFSATRAPAPAAACEMPPSARLPRSALHRRSESAPADGRSMHRSEPTRTAATAASSIGINFETPPISRSSERMIPPIADALPQHVVIQKFDTLAGVFFPAVRDTPRDSPSPSASAGATRDRAPDPPATTAAMCAESHGVSRCESRVPPPSPGKCLPQPATLVRRQPGKKLARIRHNVRRRPEPRSASHHLCRLREAQIHHRRQRAY